MLSSLPKNKYDTRLPRKTHFMDCCQALNKGKIFRILIENWMESRMQANMSVQMKCFRQSKPEGN